MQKFTGAVEVPLAGRLQTPPRHVPRASIAPRPAAAASPARDGCAGLRGDEDCARALRECLELLLDQEAGAAARGRQLTRPDSVASFLLWRRSRSRSRSGEPGDEDAASPAPGGEVPVREMREALEAVTKSRAQALDDCERMSAQVTELTRQLQGALAALSKAHAAAAENEALRNLVERQARDIYTRDALLAEMRGTLQRMRATQSEREISLALEAERAREEFIERQEVGDENSLDF